MRKSWMFMLAIAGCLVGALAATIACTQIYTGGDQTSLSVAGPSAVGSPAPGGGDGLIAIVKIGAFGSCAGVSADRTVKVGCSIPVTCTPKDAQGNQLPPSVTGLAPDFFGVSSGAQFVRAAPFDDEAFNLNVLGVAPGPFSLRCTVKGKSSDSWDAVVVP